MPSQNSTTCFTRERGTVAFNEGRVSKLLTGNEAEQARLASGQKNANAKLLTGLNNAHVRLFPTEPVLLILPGGHPPVLLGNPSTLNS